MLKKHTYVHDHWLNSTIDPFLAIIELRCKVQGKLLEYMHCMMMLLKQYGKKQYHETQSVNK